MFENLIFIGLKSIGFMGRYHEEDSKLSIECEGRK